MPSPPADANAISDAKAQIPEDRDVAIGLAPTPAEPTIAFVALRSFATDDRGPRLAPIRSPAPRPSKQKRL
jgi:hypothetical protein